MLRPVAPFVEYVINYDYIAKVLCINKDKPELSCNGKCQLMKKLAQQEQDDYNSLEINMEEYPIGFVSVLQLNNSFITTLQKVNNYAFAKEYSYLHLKSVFHPPAVSFYI